MNTEPPQFLGRYRLLRVLGRGAMGVVYEGLDTRLGRTVAIKTVLRSFLADDSTAADYAARFEREAQAAARLSHPNIVTVFDFGEQDDASYIVMEFVRGRELAQAFDSGEVFTIEQIVSLMCELLNALGAAHAQGIVHRDVKPANVMLDASGHVKLADFGVARLVDGNQERTLPGTLVGTPSYMSPEQILGQAVGSRTDLFAAGVVLYQFLTGRKPFHGTGGFGLQRAILQDEAARPSTLDVSRPPAFDAVVARALAKDPDQRHASAAAFAADLQQALAAAVADQTRVLPQEPAAAAATSATPAAGEQSAALTPPPLVQTIAMRQALATSTEFTPRIDTNEATVIAPASDGTASDWNRPANNLTNSVLGTESPALAARPDPATEMTAHATQGPAPAPASGSGPAGASASRAAAKPFTTAAPALMPWPALAQRRWWLGGTVLALLAGAAVLVTCSRPGALSKQAPATTGPSAAASPPAARPPAAQAPQLPPTPLPAQVPAPAPAPAAAPTARARPAQEPPAPAQRDPVAASPRTPAATTRDARCPELLTRIQLGDALTPEQTTFFHTRCVR